jgi:Family of unknown function (DUF6521)
MFNPALIAVIIAAAANQYEETCGFAMPWPLSFLVTPMVLHAPTREALPRTSRTSLAKWVSDNAVLSAGFPARASHMGPTVREGVRFGLREQMFALVPGNALLCRTLPKTRRNNLRFAVQVRVTPGQRHGAGAGTRRELPYRRVSRTPRRGPVPPRLRRQLRVVGMSAIGGVGEAS